jgi:hypothetical protein
VSIMPVYPPGNPMKAPNPHAFLVHRDWCVVMAQSRGRRGWGGYGEGGARTMASDGA